MKKNLLLFLTFSYGLLSSCATTSKDYSSSFLPKIVNPIYVSYNNDYERGYEVKFQTTISDIKPTAVVFNKVKKPINNAEIILNQYKVNVILQTSLISNHEVISTNLPNGIMFEHEGKVYLKKVDFKPSR